jgi:hypothetical protein
VRAKSGILPDKSIPKEIRVESSIEGAARAAGVLAIIGVFRAFKAAAVRI